MATKFLTNLDLNQNQILNASFEVVGTDPNTGNFEGRLIYNSTTDSIKVYGNGAWRAFVNSVVAGGTYTDALTVSESNGQVSLTLNLADTDSAGLLSATFWNALNDATSDATASKIAKRDANSQIKVAATPTDNAHAASKGYVDSVVSGASVSTEAVQDVVGGQFVTNGSHTGITATYDDAGDGAIDLALDSTATPTFAGLNLNGNLVFEGTTADAFETTITVTDPTEDRTITIPNVNGTVITTGNLSSITSVGTLASLTITGDLTVNGTTTTVNSTTVTIDDKNLELGSVVSPTDAGADGGGITLKGSTDKTLTWADSTDAWTSSENFNIASGKAYYINGTSVLSGTTLGSGVTGSSLTSLGTIATGVWNGTKIAIAYGGTNATTASDARTNLAETSATSRTTSTPVLARVSNQSCAASSAGTSTTTIVHNFGTTSVVVEVFEVSSGATVVADVVRTDANTVTVTMLGTITAGDYKIVVTG